MGGGREMGRFGHGSEESSHVEGGLRALGFAICVHRTPSSTMEVTDCRWAALSSVEKIFDPAAVDRRRGAVPLCLRLLLLLAREALALAHVGGGLEVGRLGLRNGVFRALWWHGCHAAAWMGRTAKE